MGDGKPLPTVGSEAELTLHLLTAVHENSAVTQRSMSRELGIALGLVNAYLKRCVSKGFIKVSQVPRNRYAYYLTPKGFAEKSRITAEFLSQSFSLFRQARQQYSSLFTECQQRGWRRVGLAGVSDLAEVASLCSASVQLEIAGVLDRRAGVMTYLGLPVVAQLTELGPVDAMVITDLRDPQASYETIAAMFPAERILVPRLLGLDRATGARTVTR